MPNVTLVQKQRLRVFFRRDGRRICAIIEHRHFGDGCARTLHVNYLFATVKTFPKCTHGTTHDDEKAVSFLAGLDSQRLTAAGDAWATPIAWATKKGHFDVEGDLRLAGGEEG